MLKKLKKKGNEDAFDHYTSLNRDSKKRFLESYLASSKSVEELRTKKIFSESVKNERAKKEKWLSEAELSREFSSEDRAARWASRMESLGKKKECPVTGVATYLFWEEETVSSYEKTLGVHTQSRAEVSCFIRKIYNYAAPALLSSTK